MGDIARRYQRFEREEAIAKCIHCPECGIRKLTHWYGCKDVQLGDGAPCCWACYIAYCAFDEMKW